MAKIQTIEIVDIENVRNEKLRYQKNQGAYLLGFLGIILSLVAAFIALNTVKPNFWTIVKILMNIVIFLFGFLSCEKVKNYQRGYSYVLFGFAFVCIARIFWMPLNMIRHWAKYRSLGNDASYAKDYFSPQVYTNLEVNKGYLAQSGYLRGALCIILLVGAALSFAFAGYLGYAKSTKLRKYLKSIDVDFNKR